MQLIVLGMHRSGTSSVTRLLNLAGAYFGAEGIATETNDENPKGFWERRDARAVCDGLLHGGGFDWWQIADFDLDRIPEDVRREQLAAFSRIVLELDEHRPWVLKEPRLALLLPLVRPLLEAPVFVYVTREPLEIAESLLTRNGFPLPVGIALWESYTIHGTAAVGDDPRVVISYGDLMHDPVGITTHLVQELTALGVPSLRMPSESEVMEFITPSLHRHRETAISRSEYLNETQGALAGALDSGGWLDATATRPLSAGAAATLRAFEEREALAVDLRETLREIAAERIRVADERIRVADEHRRGVNELNSQHRLGVNELNSRHRRSDDELGEAARRIEAVKVSGAVRLGVRISSVRERVKGGGNRGVDVAIRGALASIQRAREALVDPSASMASTGGFGLGDPAPPLAELQRQRGVARGRGERAKVAVVAWDVGHNPFGRAHLLADLLRENFEVEIWGAQFDRYGSAIWPPLRDTTIPVRRFPGSSFPEFLDTLDDVARRIDADAIFVSKPRLPSLALGAMAKELWNRPLILDVDDFELSFFQEIDGVDLDEVWRRRAEPDLSLPFGNLWTRACDSVVGQADQVTVSNPELAARYGGLIVPHARDETLFDPQRYDRDASRRRLGLKEDDRLLLFGGTPRSHKGLLELLEALEALGDDHLRLGVFATRELDDLRPQIGNLDRWILPLVAPAFHELPAVLAAADLSCALQSPGHAVSQYQMPAKVTDAMAMAVPCLVSAVPPLSSLIDKDVVEVYDGQVPLHERLRQIFDDDEASADRARRSREVFLESHSYAAVRPALTATINRLVEGPSQPAPAMSALVTTVRQIFQPESVLPRKPIRGPVPAGSTYDLVMFLKQNDTGIYGRRQDMFLKYLGQSGRFNTIVHFDQPVSTRALLTTARASIGSSDQNGLVLRQTLRRLLHRSDDGKLRQRTYLYSPGRVWGALGLPRRDRYVRWVRSVLAHEGVGGNERPVLCWVYPTNAFLPELIDELQPDVVLADVVDDNRSWYTPGTPMFDQIERNYAEVLGRSDVVLANCVPVADSMAAFAPPVEVVANACELLDGSGNPERPAALRGLSGPIIGYAGNLSDRIDVDLLRTLARTRRDWTFVLLGSTHRDRAALDLDREPNVSFLGTKRYQEAQDIIRHFDVGLIPHLDNEMTRSMNPLKAFVYCSLGVPIVSTPVANLAEMQTFLTVAEGPAEFLQAIEKALLIPRCLPDRQALRPHSWDVRIERALQLVDDVASARPELTGG